MSCEALGECCQCHGLVSCRGLRFLTFKSASSSPPALMETDCSSKISFAGHMSHSRPPTHPPAWGRIAAADACCEGSRRPPHPFTHPLHAQIRETSTGGRVVRSRQARIRPLSPRMPGNVTYIIVRLSCCDEHGQNVNITKMYLKLIYFILQTNMMQRLIKQIKMK